MVKYTARGCGLKKRSSSLAAWLQEQRSWQAPTVLAEASSADQLHHGPSRGAGQQLQLFHSMLSCFCPS